MLAPGKEALASKGEVTGFDVRIQPLSRTHPGRVGLSRSTPDLKGTRVGSGQFVTVDKTDHWPSTGEWDFYFYSEQNIAPHQSMRHC
jgi:hypothetical protein